MTRGCRRMNRPALFFFFCLAGSSPLLANDSSATLITIRPDNFPLYRCPAADSAEIQLLLQEMRVAASQPEKLRLREQNGHGVLFLDHGKEIVVKPENCVQPQFSPLANALMMRDWLVQHAVKPPWDEEELLLRLLLGIVFPFLLIVILRLTRLGLRNWEREWRSAVLQWIKKQAEQRGMASPGEPGKRVVRILLGLERLLFFSAIVVLVSFTWFTLFPQTRSLAASLIARIVEPVLSLLGDAVHALLLIFYTIAILALAHWADRHLTQRRKLPGLPDIFQDPLVYFPIRISIWIMSLFLVFFPYPGAPRIFALSVLLIAFLTGLLALRPILEEISAGIWVSRHYRLEPGDSFLLDKQRYLLISYHLAHLLVECDQEARILPYSRIIKSELILARKSGQTHVNRH